jgi:hypothetical protein
LPAGQYPLHAMRELAYLRRYFRAGSKLRQYARDQAQQAESRGREWYSLVIRRKNVALRACSGRRSREGPARTSPARGEPVGQLSFLRLVKTLLKVIGKVFTSNQTAQFVQNPEATALPSAKRCKPIVPCQKVSSKVLSRLYSFIWRTINSTVDSARRKGTLSAIPANC